MVDWSKLPEELLGLIVVRLFSVVELKRFRSICRSWRSSYVPSADNNLLPSRPLIQGNHHIYSFTRIALVSPAAFFRVTLSSSSSSQGWLIKSDADLNSGKFRLLDPLSRLTLRHSCERLDLLAFTVSEIREAYVVQDWRKTRTASPFKRAVLVAVSGEDHHRVLGIGFNGKIKYWNGTTWSRIIHTAQFSDIIVHKGLTYALDSEGIVWWINSSLSIFRYGPSLDENIINGCYRDKSFVECCGELYIVDRLLEENIRKRKAHFLNARANVGNEKCKLSESDSLKTVGFKVYKMDEEVGKLVEVTSLGDNAFVMATDTCFSVLAHEFYGCLQNSIYFTDGEADIKVFKLEDGSIATMSDSEQSCFQMFVPSFL